MKGNSKRPSIAKGKNTEIVDIIISKDMFLGTRKEENRDFLLILLGFRIENRVNIEP